MAGPWLRNGERGKGGRDKERGPAPAVPGEGGRVELGGDDGAIAGAAAVEADAAHAVPPGQAHHVPDVGVVAAPRQAWQQDQHRGICWKPLQHAWEWVWEVG